MSIHLVKRKTSPTEIPSLLAHHHKKQKMCKPDPSLATHLPSVLIQSVTNFLRYSDVVKVQRTCKALNKIYPMNNTLYLTSNYLSGDEILSILQKIPRIESLQLLVKDNCKENEKIFEKLGQSTSLIHLHLEGYFTNAHLEKLTISNYLTSINVEFTDEINDTSLALLAKIKSLKKVNVSDTEITDLGLVYMNELPQLEELYVRHCPYITKNGIDGFEIERALSDLPPIKIHRSGIS